MKTQTHYMVKMAVIVACRGSAADFSLSLLGVSKVDHHEILNVLNSVQCLVTWRVKPWDYVGSKNLVTFPFLQLIKSNVSFPFLMKSNVSFPS